MKISFSTLACPDYSWVDIYSMAKDLGFGGIEIRGLGQDIFAVNARPFTDERLPKTLEKLHALGLEIPCLADSPSNQIFPILPMDKARRLMDACACEVQQKVGEDRLCVRFVTSWATKDSDVDALSRLLRSL